VHAKRNAYSTTMLSLMKKKTERITMLNEKKKRKEREKYKTRVEEGIINKKLMNDAEV
jgi:archaellum component FlaC